MVAGIVITLIMLTVLALALGWSRQLRGPKIARLGQRNHVSPTDFYLTHYSNAGLSKEVVLQLLQEIADATEVPATLLRPSDRFSVELAPIRDWELEDGPAQLAFLTKLREKKTGVGVDIARIQTVDDYIRTNARLEGQPQDPHSGRH